MGKALQNVDDTGVPVAGQPAPAAAPPVRTSDAANDSLYDPPHHKTQSTLAPTAEFTRIFLLAWIIRYVFRGAAGTLFAEKVNTPGLRNKITDWLSSPGRVLEGWFSNKVPLNQLEAATYAGAIGIGSVALSYRYSKLVKTDIQNIFCEAVAYEKDKSPAATNFSDIESSDNRIVQRTVQNYREKFFGRLGTDALFFVAAALRHAPLTDLFLGFKGVQIFADTWKRKTTMFEDLISFINNKINPRNGLGQKITVGEVFDLYQHYAEKFMPDRMFKNVLEGTGHENALWAQNQQIFQRITDLMNLTYAYKHSTVLDPATGLAMPQAHFALPKLIYLLGHDLIDVKNPTQTLATIEIANHYGIPAVKEMQQQLHAGTPLADIAKRYPTPETARNAEACKGEEEKRNTVIPKGSSMQPDGVPEPKSSVDTSTTSTLGKLAAGPSLERSTV